MPSSYLTIFKSFVNFYLHTNEFFFVKLMGFHQVCELGRTSEGMEDLTGLAITFKLMISYACMRTKVTGLSVAYRRQKMSPMLVFPKGPSESYMATNKNHDDITYAKLKRVKDLSKLFHDIPLTSETFKMEPGYFEH